MNTLLSFKAVANEKVTALSFNLEAGQMRVLKVASQERLTAVIDLALGELIPASGEISLLGQPLAALPPGSIACIPAAGGLISNLKAWENITLPLWYHTGRQPQPTEALLTRWLLELQMNQQDWETFMASPAARLKPWERKLAGLLRGLLLAPKVLVVDAGLFEEVEASRVQLWIKSLETFARETNDHAVLVVASSATILPWEIIE